ncbi:MAG: hypothetical protein N3E36_01165 [Sulfolobales archaeon]|nr:hypothetical protein [Sulfolobales archaeon]MCX8198625.1 hypothetical protein [Sulfolobales archaeon]MDW8169699.1 hypothetical protein [Desulfurococcaceae archaeon]
MPPKKRVSRGIAAQILSFDTFNNFLFKLSTIALIMTTLAILSEWPSSLSYYAIFPTTVGYRALGLSTMVTAFALMSVLIALLLPKYLKYVERGSIIETDLGFTLLVLASVTEVVAVIVILAISRP